MARKRILIVEDDDLHYELYQEALARRNSLLVQFGVLLGAILLLSAGIGHSLLKGIRVPLAELTAVMETHRQGDLDARSRHVSANEFGMLAASFNNLAGTIQEEFRSKDHGIVSLRRSRQILKDR